MGQTADKLLTVTEERARSRVGVKWTKHGPDVIPSFVADMDFDPPPAVIAAIRGHLHRGDLGYGPFSDALGPAYATWQQRRHGWSPDVERIRPFTSVLHALETALWCTTEPGDGVVVFTPSYFPFLEAVADSRRRLVDCPLEPDGWRLDGDRLEALIDDTTRVIIVCHPHNPTGRVFDAAEIDAIADVADRHDLFVISDEIWGDLLFPGEVHRPLATVDDRFAGRLMTLGSASKTFNLAGLRAAVAHVDHAPLLARLDSTAKHQHGSPSSISITGTIAAWTDSDMWLDAARRTIDARRTQLARRLERDAPSIGFEPPQATYLAWLDLSGIAGGRFGSDPSIPLLELGRVAVAGGEKFGTGGPGHARITLATSEEILDETIDRIIGVIDLLESAATGAKPAISS
jgi:cystathionine beta-lyase